MNATLLRMVATLALVTGAAAQSIYIDFGDPGSPHGIPAATYGAAGPPGIWQGVSTQVTNGLIDTTGAATAAALTISAAPMLDDCGHAGTLGDDQALYDDRCFYDPVFVELTVSGLQPGIYLVHMHLLVGPCVSMFPPLTVDIAGAVPPTFDVGGFTWNGQPEEGHNYSTQLVVIEAGDSLTIQTSSPPGFLSYTQHCGLQLVRVEAFETGCAGDGSGAACPCGNSGASDEGCLNSTGVGGRLSPNGTSSVSTDDLRFTGQSLPPGQPALLFAGDQSIAGGAGVPFGDGIRCAGGTTVRLGLRVPNSAGLAFWGPGLAPSGGWQPGDQRELQVWHRDPSGPCNGFFNLTNSVRVLFVP